MSKRILIEINADQFEQLERLVAIWPEMMDTALVHGKEKDIMQLMGAEFMKLYVRADVTLPQMEVIG